MKVEKYTGIKWIFFSGKRLNKKKSEKPETEHPSLRNWMQLTKYQLLIRQSFTLVMQMNEPKSEVNLLFGLWFILQFDYKAIIVPVHSQ